MAKKKNLNGIPGNLALSYLSTLGYYDGGYMADWINYISREKNEPQIEVDILSKRITPKSVEIKPLKACLDKLQGILRKELKKNGFEDTFIQKAILRFEIPINKRSIKKTIYCYPYLEDSDGNLYKPKKRIIETASEVDLKLIKKLEIESVKMKEGFIAKLKKLLKK